MESKTVLMVGSHEDGWDSIDLDGEEVEIIKRSVSHARHESLSLFTNSKFNTNMSKPVITAIFHASQVASGLDNKIRSLYLKASK